MKKGLMLTEAAAQALDYLVYEPRQMSPRQRGRILSTVLVQAAEDLRANGRGGWLARLLL